MAIQANIVNTNKAITYPVVMQHRLTRCDAEYGELVVLFSSNTRGVALTGVESIRIGREECWHACDDPNSWEPCAITLSSKD